MSDTKFTPGPWCACQKRTIHGDGITIDADYSISAMQNKIPWYGLATVITSTEGGDRDEEGEANAHLIAAAPDMYEALESFVDFFSCVKDTKSVPEIWESAKNALAKARGEA